MHAPPLVVLAAPGTPATRLAAMLGRHPRLAPLPQLNWLMAERVDDLLALFALAQLNLEDGLLRAVAELYCGGQSGAGVAAARRWLERRGDRATSELLVEFAERLAPRRPVLAETDAGWKPEYLDRLLAHFPDAPVLHLIDHPRPHCEALVADLGGRLFVAPDYKDYALDEVVIDPQLAWLRVNANIGRVLEALPPSQWRRLHAEDLYAAPEAVLTALCDWLGLATTAPAIETMLRPEQGPFAGIGPAEAPLGGDIAQLRAPAFVRRLRPRTALAGPLGWRTDGSGFAAEVLELARSYGYA